MEHCLTYNNLQPHRRLIQAPCSCIVDSGSSSLQVAMYLIRVVGSLLIFGDLLGHIEASLYTGNGESK